MKSRLQEIAVEHGATFAMFINRVYIQKEKVMKLIADVQTASGLRIPETCVNDKYMDGSKVEIDLDIFPKEPNTYYVVRFYPSNQESKLPSLWVQRWMPLLFRRYLDGEKVEFRIHDSYKNRL